MPPRKKKLTKREQMLARHQAIRLLASMAEDDEVIQALQAEYGVQEAIAKAIVVAAWKEIVSADDGLETSHKKGLLLSATREHYRRCLEKNDLAQGTASLRLLARLFGVDRVETTETQGLPKDEFAGRSAKELKHYAQHGHFPDDGKPVKGQKKKDGDPLAGLH